MSRNCVCLLILIFLTFTAKSASAASFDCAKATSKNEILICAANNLSLLDEQYAGLYKRERASTQQPAQVKMEAIEAYRWRERNCSSIPCLQTWYIDRILTLKASTRSGTASAKLDTRSDVTLKQLYKKLNLASIGYTGLTTTSGSTGVYPYEVFANDIVSFESNDTLVFDNDGIAVSISVVAGNKVILSRWGRGMRSKYIKEGDAHQLFFNQQHNDWRATSENSTRNSTDRTTTLTYRSRHQTSHADSREPHSVGEFLLSRFNGPKNQSGCVVEVVGMAPADTKLCELPTIKLYDAAGGQHTGSLRTALVKGRHTGASDAEVWLLNKRGISIAEPIVLSRRKEDIVLLAFGFTKVKQDELGWLNISPNPAQPAWINREEIGSDFNSIFYTREQVVDNSNEVKLSSNHNLRVQPSTNSTVVKVIKKDEGRVYPMNVSGDWMQVQFVNPSPPEDWVRGVRNNLDSSYTQLQGWIKWRKHIGREYVQFEYWHDRKTY